MILSHPGETRLGQELESQVVSLCARFMDNDVHNIVTFIITLGYRDPLFLFHL